MPNSKKRKGHHPHHPQNALSSAPKQKASGHLIWSVMIGLFAVLIGWMAAGSNWIVLGLCAIAGAIVGYFVGKSMERTMKE